jgi:hypothetical protein
MMLTPRFVGGALSLLFVLVSPAASVDTERKLGKKDGKGKGKGGGKKDAAAPALMCAPEDQGFMYHPPMMDDPWEYPHPFLYAGYIPTAVLTALTGVPQEVPIGSVSLPLNTDDATAAGWIFEEESCKWINPNPRLSNLKLAYMHGSIFGLEIVYDRFTGLYPLEWYSETGSLSMYFNDGMSNEFSIVDSKMGTIPMGYEDAEQVGWSKGSCVGAMGGYHFVPEPLSTPYMPTYDMKGDGLMKSIIMVGGSFHPDFFFTKDGFDGYGLGFTEALNCDLNFCDLEDNPMGCYDALYKLTGGLEDNFDLNLYLAANHVFWGTDPALPDTWGECHCDPKDCRCCDGHESIECRGNDAVYPAWYTPPAMEPGDVASPWKYY